MTILGIFIKVIILTVVVGLLCVAFFVFLNARESKIDEHSYDSDQKSQDSLVSYRVGSGDEEQEPDPSQTLKRYEHKTPKT